jgi:hypothetical protein
MFRLRIIVALLAVVITLVVAKSPELLVRIIQSPKLEQG